MYACTHNARTVGTIIGTCMRRFCDCSQDTSAVMTLISCTGSPATSHCDLLPGVESVEPDGPEAFNNGMQCCLRGLARAFPHLASTARQSRCGCGLPLPCVTAAC
jgi:hypothetical protein